MLITQFIRKIKLLFYHHCFRLDASEMSAKSEVAATRLRYEPQIKNLQTELTSLQVNYYFQSIHEFNSIFLFLNVFFFV